MNNPIVRLTAVDEYQVLLNCLQLFNNSSIRSISSRVQNLDIYAQKLLTQAENYCARLQNNIVGFISLYANQRHTAYISIIAVKKGNKRLGIGSMLINKAIEIATEKGMKQIKLEVDNQNVSAIAFYKMHGFVNSEPAGPSSNYFVKEL